MDVLCHGKYTEIYRHLLRLLIVGVVNGVRVFEAKEELCLHCKVNGRLQKDSEEVETASNRVRNDLSDGDCQGAAWSDNASHVPLPALLPTS